MMRAVARQVCEQLINGKQCFIFPLSIFHTANLIVHLLKEKRVV